MPLLDEVLQWRRLRAGSPWLRPDRKISAIIKREMSMNAAEKNGHTPMIKQDIYSVRGRIQTRQMRDRQRPILGLE